MSRLKAILTTLLLWVTTQQGGWAQDTAVYGTTNESYVTGWYGGVEGGVPFGMSTFSSFGADKVHVGYFGGLFGGFRFSPLLSAEISMKWGKNILSARDCCVQSGYWLGVDGNTFHSSVAGMEGSSYSDLKSCVAMQEYGIRLNVNVFGLFPATRQSRWALDVSPEFSVIGTRATLRYLSNDKDMMQDGTRWHLGIGSNIGASYALTRDLSIGVYSGIKWLTGKGLDGITEHVHKTHCLWENGVRVGWTFGKKCKKIVEPVPVIEEQYREAKP